MPTYVFSCSNSECCEGDEPLYIFEVMQAMNERHEAVCPKCGGAGKRELTVPGIGFKGSGFHVNDYPRH